MQPSADLEERFDHSGPVSLAGFIGLCVVSSGSGKRDVRGLGPNLIRTSGTWLCSGGRLGSVTREQEGLRCSLPSCREPEGKSGASFEYMSVCVLASHCHLASPATPSASLSWLL